MPAQRLWYIPKWSLKTQVQRNLCFSGLAKGDDLLQHASWPLATGQTVSLPMFPVHKCDVCSIGSVSLLKAWKAWSMQEIEAGLPPAACTA